VLSGNGQLVRSGDCVTAAGANVDLETGTAGDRSQEWTIGG
jgi:hypothetical protein